MFVANIAVHTFTHMSTAAIWLFQDQGAVGFDPISLWKQMGILAKIVVVILFIMSGWSIGVMIDRAMAFNAARKQSRAFAPAVAGAPGSVAVRRIHGSYRRYADGGRIDVDDRGRVVLEYAARLTAELRDLALEDGHHVLAYLLEMAAQECAVELDRLSRPGP